MELHERDHLTECPSVWADAPVKREKLLAELTFINDIMYRSRRNRRIRRAIIMLAALAAGLAATAFT